MVLILQFLAACCTAVREITRINTNSHNAFRSRPYGYACYYSRSRVSAVALETRKRVGIHSGESSSQPRITRMGKGNEDRGWRDHSCYSILYPQSAILASDPYPRHPCHLLVPKLRLGMPGPRSCASTSVSPRALSSICRGSPTAEMDRSQVQLGNEGETWERGGDLTPSLTKVTKFLILSVPL